MSCGKRCRADCGQDTIPHLDGRVALDAVSLSDGSIVRVVGVEVTDEDLSVVGGEGERRRATDRHRDGRSQPQSAFSEHRGAMVYKKAASCPFPVDNSHSLHLRSPCPASPRRERGSCSAHTRGRRRRPSCSCQRWQSRSCHR